MINKYGAAINVFTVAGGIALAGQPLSNALFVLDGDVFITNEEKEIKIKKVLTGDDPKVKNLIDPILTSMVQFNLPQNISPEKKIPPENFIFDCVRNLTNQSDLENEEIRKLTSDIVNAGDHHNLVKRLVEQLGLSEEIVLNRLIRAASQSSNWLNFSDPVRSWLEAKKTELHLG
ncbi:hypothetical protein [[Phormidium ambiguum] IAM M-71]|uniref:hypothetical protein n=1 Tax=[Phormidium ambiguum] IAM M-71 TaxID=454136 RepID=UPI0011611BDF|nr:hypothetical protein [Phormidium ambiguum]